MGPDAGILERLIERTASSNIYKYWVNRTDDGGGIVEGKKHIHVDEFPGYLISDNWPNNERLSLVSNYIAWITPSLLTLQHLNSDERGRLRELFTCSGYFSGASLAPLSRD